MTIRAGSAKTFIRLPGPENMWVILYRKEWQELW
jgi:hypothetical protein